MKVLNVESTVGDYYSNLLYSEPGVGMSFCPYRARAKLVLGNLTFHALPWLLESVSSLIKVLKGFQNLYYFA